jgi:hypothetical protein
MTMTVTMTMTMKRRDRLEMGYEHTVARLHCLQSGFQGVSVAVLAGVSRVGDGMGEGDATGVGRGRCWLVLRRVQAARQSE